jgi:hypothetical protein
VYAPGESPFHVRGSTYIRVRDYAAERVSGGMQAVAGALPEGPHRSFALQAFTAKGWYDALPIRPITELIAKLEGRAWEESVRGHAENIARRDLGLLGRVRMRASSPERMVEKLQHAALETFDFGESEVTEADKGRARVVFHQVPQPLGSWFLAMIHGYAGILLNHAGAKAPEIGGRLIPKGRAEGGMGLVDVRVDLNWSR